MMNRRGDIGARDPWREVVVDGVRLAFNDEGRGPPIVCLHAIGHGAGDFTDSIARWRDRHRVIAIDWPGQGRSGPDHVPASATRYLRLFEEFIEAAAVRSPVVIGNSIGGAVAIQYAAANPRHVRALVLENPGGLVSNADTMTRIALRNIIRFFEAGARGARWFPPAFGAYYRCVLQRGAAAPQRRRIVAAWAELAPVLAEAWRSFAEPTADIRTLAPSVTCPVLFAWATRDQLVQLRRSLPAIRQFPAARLEKFPAGHAAHLETPAAFGDTVDRFLAEIA